MRILLCVVPPHVCSGPSEARTQANHVRLVLGRTFPVGDDANDGTMNFEGEPLRTKCPSAKLQASCLANLPATLTCLGADGLDRLAPSAYDQPTCVRYKVVGPYARESGAGWNKEERMHLIANVHALRDFARHATHMLI